MLHRLAMAPAIPQPKPVPCSDARLASLCLSLAILQPGDIFRPVYVEDDTFLRGVEECNILACLEQAASAFIARKPGYLGKGGCG